MDADSSGRLLFFIGNASTSAGDTNLKLILNLIVLLLLIFFNAAFAASEMAVITLNDNKVRLMAEEGDRRAQRIMKFLDKPTNFLSTIQVGITFAGFFASALAASKFAEPMTQWIRGSGLDFAGLSTIVMILVTAILSYISLVFGELVPKRIAMHSPDGVLKYTLGLLILVGTFLKPFVCFLTFSTSVVLKIFGIHGDKNDRTVTEEEIRMMVNVGRETGTIHEDEKEMIENIFELNDTQVSEIMTHRTNIAALDIDSTFEEVLAITVSEKFTRIPVYKDSIDNIVGILHTKDLLIMAVEGLTGPFRLEDMIRDPFFIPETKMIDTAFREMQLARAQIAVVIDEYGGTAGIITMEDLLEEIVGNMQDEYDEEPEEIVRIDDNTLIVDGFTSLDEISDELKIKLPEDRDYDTIAGLVLDLLGRIPDEDEHPEVMYFNLKFKVSKMEEKRISEIRIEIVPPENSENESNNTDEKAED